MIVRTERSKVRQSRWALAAGVSIVAVFSLSVLFADFLAPYPYYSQRRDNLSAPPTDIRLRDVTGSWHVRPFIYAEPLVDSSGHRYAIDTRQAFPLALLTRGYSYRLLGFFPTNIHLFGLQNAEKDAPRIYLLGADEFGRDRFSRLLLAAHFSLLVGLKATLFASLLGVVIGSLGGYARHLLPGRAGRWLDAVLMRGADVMLALPTLVLILAVRATYPPELPPERASSMMITILVALGWAEMARLVYGLVLELRERDFIYAAMSLGSSPARVLFRHILPNAARPLLAQVLLILPAFLLAEISLSYLGVGLQEPEPSWGNMLTSATDLTSLERSDAWAQITPAFAIMLFVFGVRLLGKGLQNDWKE